MLLAHRKMGNAHIEDNAAILQQRRCRMVRQIVLDG
jgi:hypothetical protein